MIKLRAPEPEDINIIYEWENDSEFLESGCNVAPVSLNQITDYVLNYDADIYKAGQLKLLIHSVELNKAIGCIDLYDFDAINNRCFIGFLIDKKFQNRGYATIAIRSLIDYCRNRLSLKQIAAITSCTNTYSIRLLENCGFQNSGKLEKWIKGENSNYKDAFIFQLLLN